jgi:ferredoxin-NADP reductase
VGDVVYVDGPFGALSADRFPNRAGYIFIAGGIGITPMISHLRTFADRNDNTPCWLFYGSPTFDAITYREELDALAAKLPNLTLIHVLSKPDPSWQGEGGFITKDLLARHLPADLATTRNRYEFFICGPVPMMQAIEQSLATLGVKPGDYHAERFDLV